MNRKEQQHLLELIVNSSAKQQGDFKKTAELVCQQLREYFAASFVSVWSLRNKNDSNGFADDDDFICEHTLVASKVNDKLSHLSHLRQMTIDPQYFNELRSHRYILSTDSTHINLVQTFSEYYQHHNIATSIDIAIRINGHIEGILSVESCEEARWIKSDIQFAIQCADQLALTLSTRYTYDRNEQVYMLRNATEQSEHVVMLVNTDSRIIEYVNSAHEKMTGLPRSSVEHHSASNLDVFRHTPQLLDQVINKLRNSEIVKGDLKLARIDGSEYWINYHVTPFVTEQGKHYALVSSYDNSAEYLHKAELERLAWHCSLTGLHNRSHFTPILDSATEGTLILIDLLGFKRFNDTHGHEQGDALLIETARRLQYFAETSNAIDVARIGSDEFAVLLPPMLPDTDVEQMISQLYMNLAASSVIYREKVEPRPAIAVVDIKSVVGLFNPLSCADITLQVAKKNNDIHYQFFNEALLEAFNTKAEIEHDLHHAIRGREFELYYQPLMDLQNNQYIGAEALIRWHHPKKGVLYPGAFIEIAEQTGMINQIGEWVLETACKQLNLWQHKDVNIAMHVNVAARQFFSGNLYEQVWRFVTRYRIKPKTLILEITETELMGDIRYAIKLCHELAELGVGLAIDDFGTGYSSMKYLKQFPISKLKIDRSFIMDICSSHESREIVSAIIAMAKALNISLTAEGVETKEQEAFLTLNACDHAQGFLYSPAIRVNDFALFINAHEMKRHQQALSEQHVG
ncbi:MULTISPECIES: bifunctional diguanylate cyclase/phosphodiesterase [Shewanella]|uniref:GGDEF and EAL domain-containing protein n=1 Tax=Shewanella psychromarinicola TaxID=2487742 RepID=A0A3N4EBJ6_9GAMM|nr:EAL domain-containing protein [Shewanella psychromarinicola]AZG36393.1 GGDEF and EAL domain-containing protein [Shewanella psychromarinicola]MCL1080728.1 EAL domain-containing protein [Shewanella psychromarinicola]RPA34236.1 GGDEF and EAL domain-containing protein [Shewanella psychromarinicola]